MEDRRELTRSAGKKEKCAEEMARKVCVRRRIKQTLSSMVGVEKRLAQERLLVLLGYDLIARRTRAEKDIEPGEKPRNQMNRVRVKLGGDREDDVLYDWRVKAIEGIAYSR